MKKALSLPVLLVILTFSCRKDNNKPVEPEKQIEIDYAKLTDSVTFSLDGANFYFNNRHGSGGGTAAAIYDSVTRTYNADTLQYHLSYSVSQYPTVSNNGNFEISFAKNFAKTQLTRVVSFGIKAPPSDTLLFFPGEHTYAVDFERYNRQNGVVLDISKGVANTGAYRSFISKSPQSVTTIPADCQNNSKFTVLKMYKLPNNDGHIIEAIFSVNLFDKDEVYHRVDNGYIGLHVD